MTTIFHFHHVTVKFQFIIYVVLIKNVILELKIRDNLYSSVVYPVLPKEGHFYNETRKNAEVKLTSKKAPF